MLQPFSGHEWSIAVALTCTIDQAGITAPDYADILASMTASYKGIFGQDAYLDPDSQDGQLLAIFALAMHDTNSATITAYNAFSPATAQGEGLSRVVKINGIARTTPGYSKADVVITGQVGTLITGGIVTDPLGGRWFLDGPVTVGTSGQATASVTYELPGAVVAPANTLSVIGSPSFGWQSVTNPAAAVLGAPVETDAALRVRQGRSTALPSRSVLDGMIGAVASLPGVVRLLGYENDTNLTDANGAPSHSVAFVVDGGDAQTIANAIGAKKGPGVGTYGTTAQSVTDVYAIPRPISFFRPTVVPIAVQVFIKAGPGYVSPTGAAIEAAVASYINALPIAGSVRLSRLYVPIDATGDTFFVTSLLLARGAATPVAADVVIAFNEAASCTMDNVVLTVT